MRKKVYILSASFSGSTFYKVGIAADVERRRIGIQVGCPFPVLIEKIYECQFASKVENDSHRALSSFRTSGEWFQCGLSHIEKIVSMAIAGDLTGKNRKRYGDRKKTFTQRLSFFDDALDR